MFHRLLRVFKGTKRSYAPIDPDEIFLDDKNLPDFDTSQFEGRIERPLPRAVFAAAGIFILLVASLYAWRLWALQVVEGETYRDKSENNRLREITIFANRGIIYDRNAVPLTWNTINADSPDFSLRRYATSTGLSTLLGYVKYPSKDKNGFYYQYKFDPKDGLEKVYDEELEGVNGTKMVETDVHGVVTAESVIDPPKDGRNLVLTIDARLQKKLYDSMLDIAGLAGYKGGAGVIMDVRTGEVLALANFPEYDSSVMTDGRDKDAISGWIESKDNPFLNRTIDGLYTPGSIVKPFIAMGVLDLGVIDPLKNIYSSGSISVPNPYSPTRPSIFYDWKAHGYVDLRRALAVSSNVYFYEVGGGFSGQEGIGISNIEKYVRMFGLGQTTGVNFPGEKNGTIPNPAWKEAVFNDAWRLGDTYNTAIGQYGFQVSPIQVVRAVAALANRGTLLVPKLVKGESAEVSGTFSLRQEWYKIVSEGMRLCVTDGTCRALDIPGGVEVAAKTGTAQIGLLKDEVNSWVVGYWPYQNPRYAFAVVMERGTPDNQFGSVLVMQKFMDWLNTSAAEYAK